ncbi:MAG: class I SAM-dependent methyltransferase [Parvibaculum sp.]
MTNQAQKDFWNGPAGAGWVSGQESMDRSLSGVTEALLARANVRPGERVIDIGCGTGETSLLAASGAGQSGLVLGVDISGPMSSLARDRAVAAGLANVTFKVADAQTDALLDRASLLLSRFGVMFFEDPVAAFANMRAHMAPGGRLCFACWQSPKLNQWVSLPVSIVRKYVTDDAPRDPHAPGPFAFADPARLEKILGDAGWRDIAIEPVDFEMPWGSSPEAAAAGLVERGPVRPMVEGLAPEVVEKIVAEIASALPQQEGAIGLKGAIFVVKACA